MIRLLLFSICIVIPQILLAQVQDEDSPEERIRHETKMTIDPALGRVPFERLVQEREKLHKGLQDKTIKTAIVGLNWYERGPNNIGGRTRALMFDPNDATKKRVFAGGVGGGLEAIHAGKFGRVISGGIVDCHAT